MKGPFRPGMRGRRGGYHTPLGAKWGGPPCPRQEKPKKLKFVEPVERGDLVRFRKSRIVEHCVAEIFDGAAVVQHGLPDVNNFSGALPDHMHPQQLARIAIE